MLLNSVFSHNFIQDSCLLFCSVCLPEADADSKGSFLFLLFICFVLFIYSLFCIQYCSSEFKKSINTKNSIT